MTTKNNIKEKIQYEKEKSIRLEEKIKKEGGAFNSALITLDSNLQVIKDILVKNNFITEEKFELEYHKKAQIILKRLLDMIKELKKSQGKKIILPNMVPPRDLKKVRA